MMTSLPRAIDADEPSTARVTMSLQEYMGLLEKARELEQTAALPDETASAAAEVVSQQLQASIHDEMAELQARYEIVIDRVPAQPIMLPVAGFAWKAEIEPSGGSALQDAQGGVELVATEPGRFAVTIESVAEMKREAGASRLKLAPVVAPVAVAELDLPAELAWSCGGAVVSEEKISGSIRQVRLGLIKGELQTLTLRREIKAGQAERALVQASVTTLVQIRGSGAVRHDIVQYHLSRGSLADLEVELPDGFEVERLATDEGELPPLVESGAVRVTRSRLLKGSGFLVISGRAGAGGLPVSVEPVRPAVEVRGRYLAVTSEVPTRLQPRPEPEWSRIDLDDLPGELGRVAEGLRLTAAWAWSGAQEMAGERASLGIEPLPLLEQLPAYIAGRTTTTLLTVEGTLLHRDVLRLAHAGPGISLRLDPGVTLWSCSVHDEPVRPVERDGAMIVPVGLNGAEGVEVEIITVREQALPGRRDRFSVSLPQVEAPVLQHHWRVLLPEGHRYRYLSGTLRPATDLPPSAGRPHLVDQPVDLEHGFEDILDRLQGAAAIIGVAVDDGNQPLPGVTVVVVPKAVPSDHVSLVTDARGRFYTSDLLPGMYRVVASLPGFTQYENDRVRLRENQVVRLAARLNTAYAEEILVTSEMPLVADMRTLGKEGRSREDADSLASAAAAGVELDQLREGLVSGVKPVPIEIPEGGKSLLMVGGLPSGQVTVEIEAKAERGRSRRRSR